MRVLVIGAGSSGLVTAKTLRERGHEVSVVTDELQVGGTFANKSYAGARMVSSRYLTCFSDFRARPGAELHMSLVDYVGYLREYCDHFGLAPAIRYGRRVVELRREKAGPDVLRYVAVIESVAGGVDRVEEFFDAVAVCSGVHNVPRVPRFEGRAQFEGKVVHSCQYKDPTMFADRRVLVVGTGETGFDVAHAAATGGASSVALSTRHGFVSVPSSFGEDKPPLDSIIMNWGTHAWESDWAQRTGFHWWLTTKFTRTGFLLTTGTTYGFNQWAGKRFNMTWDEGRKHIVNKSTRCMPLINRKIKRAAPRWQRWLWGWWDGPDDGSACDVDLVEGPIEKFGRDGVTFSTISGPQFVPADIVVLATGYRQRFPFLGRSPAESSSAGGEDAANEGEANEGEDMAPDDPLPEEHFIVDPSEPRLAYIGFVRPNVGAIPPMAELQAMWWSQRLEGVAPKERSPDRYKLQGSRLSYGVDYGVYMFALAREIGAVPSLLHWLWRRPAVAITCCFGQAHVPIFRLEGPFANKECEDTCAVELLRPILQRPVVMNLVFVFEAVFFGVFNAIAAVLDSPGWPRRAVAAGSLGGLGLACCALRRPGPALSGW